MSNVLIIGAGSIGVFLGTKLYSSGQNVFLYGRRKLEEIEDVVLIDGKTYKSPPKIKLKKGMQFDYIFVTTKLYDTLKAVNEIIKNKIKYKMLCIIQNGLVDDNFYQNIGKNYARLAIFQGYNLNDNKIITSKSKMGWMIENNKNAKEIYDLIKKSGIEITKSDEVDKFRAEKMLINCSVNALSAIYNVPVGKILIDLQLREKCENLFDETYEVLNKEFDIGDKEDLRKRFYEVINSVAHHYSSTHQDLFSKRKTEIEFLNGYIIRLGKRLNISTPENEKIYNTLLRVSSQTHFSGL